MIHGARVFGSRVFWLLPKREHGPRPTGPLAEFFAEWRPWLRAKHGLTDVVAIRSERMVIRFLHYGTGDSSLAAALKLSQQRIELVFIELKYGPELAPTVWKAICRFFEFAFTRGLIPAAPVVEGKYPGRPEPGRVGAADLEDHLAKWDRWLFAEHRLKKPSRESARVEVLRLLEHLDRGNDLATALSVVQLEIRDYLATPKRSTTYTTRRIAWNDLDRFYAYALESGLVRSNPAAGAYEKIDRKRVDPSTAGISSDDVEKLFTAAGKLPVPWLAARERALLHFLYTEMLAPKDVLAMGETGRAATVRRRGGGTVAHELQEVTQAALSGYRELLPFPIAAEDRVFRNDSGGELKDHTLRTYMARLAGLAGVEMSSTELRRSGRNHRRDGGERISAVLERGHIRRIGTVVSAPTVDEVEMFAAFRSTHPRWGG